MGSVVPIWKYEKLTEFQSKNLKEILDTVGKKILLSEFMLRRQDEGLQEEGLELSF